MCPHSYHHSGSMATPALGTQDVRYIYIYIFLYLQACNLTCSAEGLKIAAIMGEISLDTVTNDDVSYGVCLGSKLVSYHMHSK